MKCIVSTLVLALAVATVATEARSAGKEASLQESLDRATQDGRPVLAVAARSTCPRCAAFLKRLESDASLRPMLAKYIQVVVNVDGPGCSDLARKQQLGGGLPLIYVLRADGDVIAATANGTAAPLADMLKDGLAKSGRILSQPEAARADGAVTKARTALENNDVALAAAALTGLGSTESFATPLVTAKQLLDEINGRATRDIAACRLAFEEDADSFTAVVKVAEALRTYEKLPAQKQPLAELQNLVRRRDGGRAMLAQADAVARARSFRNLGRTDAAARAYQQVVHDFPGTPAAALAAKELATVTGKSS